MRLHVCLYMELFQCVVVENKLVKCWEAVSVLITMDMEAEAERRKNEREKKTEQHHTCQKYIPLVCFFLLKESLL